ncbi:LysM peptidoglycan-binding domain-containing protein [Fontivita pretiosa]|uniref:LysM peptidoglycan-binding domain-containing protein n=1 Tax=Fontivita pretiosa TaxID=2989684 RepID=UPI003D1683E9
MMRTDVKLGFAIGGVLLAVLIVYVLVISGPDDQPQQVSLDTATSTSATQASPGNSGAASADPARAANTVDPFTPTTGVASVNSDAEGASGESMGALPGSAADQWSAALNDGRIPVMMTSTPQPAAPDTPQPAVATPPLRAEANQSTPAELNGSSPGGAAQSAGALPPVAASNSAAALAPGAVSPSLESSAASESRPDASASAAPGARTHVVQPGESFATIAQAAYGSAAYYPHLIRANPTLDPRKLRPGMVINLPPISQVRADSTTAAASDSPRATAAAPATDPRTEYRVQPNDSLYKISLKLYGKADRVDKLYELNKSTIGPNPARLKEGMVLKLPEPPTTR